MKFFDNKFAINIAHNSMQHDRIKHIEVDWCFIKEKLDSELITTMYVPSGLTLIDMLTKGLLPERFQDLNIKLGMIHNSFISMRGSIEISLLKS